MTISPPQTLLHPAIYLLLSINGGEISKIRLKHIWVEVAIDYLPSRGAKNKAADSWVSFDPYKQYECKQGLNIV